MNAYSRLLLICDTHQHYSAAMARAQALAGSAGASLHMLMIDSLDNTERTRLLITVAVTFKRLIDG